MSGADEPDDLSQAIDEVYNWLCAEAAPDVRARLHQMFDPDVRLCADAVEAMLERDWLRRQEDGRLMMTSKGLSELSQRRPDLRGT
ncbi:hypothetical protein ACFODL_06690 [Phenylobacterium terrae]|uniref:Uncharacterized protein n=1 Tax=Phenylobacterium terrae TaxID=2665495 RepID=A0ABW4NA48_9CAUL